MLPITQSKQAGDDWGTTHSEEATNGDEEIAMTHAKSYDILIPEGRSSKFHHAVHYYKGMKQLCNML